LVLASKHLFILTINNNMNILYKLAGLTTVAEPVAFFAIIAVVEIFCN